MSLRRSTGSPGLVVLNGTKPIRTPILRMDEGKGTAVELWTLQLRAVVLEQPAFPFDRDLAWLLTWQGEHGGCVAEIDACAGMVVTIAARSFEVAFLAACEPAAPEPPASFGIRMRAEATAAPGHIGHRAPTRTLRTAILAEGQDDTIEIPAFARSVSIWSPNGIDMIAGGVTLVTSHDALETSVVQRRALVTSGDWWPLVGAERYVRITNNASEATRFALVFEIGL